jgi:hypothetical protein
MSPERFVKGESERTSQENQDPGTKKDQPDVLSCSSDLDCGLQKWQEAAPRFCRYFW